MGKSRSSSPSRGGGGGRSIFGGSSSKSSAPAPKPAAKPAAPAPPAVQQSAPAPAAGGGMMSGMAGTLVNGMVWGTGTAMANRAVDAVMGGRTVVHEHRDAPTEGGQEMMQSSTSSSSRSSQFCQFETEQFQNCMRDYNNDVSACGNFYDMLKSCQRQ